MILHVISGPAPGIYETKTVLPQKQQVSVIANLPEQYWVVAVAAEFDFWIAERLTEDEAKTLVAWIAEGLDEHDQHKYIDIDSWLKQIRED